MVSDGSRIGGATRWVHKISDMRVQRSRSIMKDGSEWIRISVSFRDHIPTWQNLIKAKNEFIGEDQEACIILANVNLHPFCMHIWAPVSQIKHLPNLKDIKSDEAV